LGRSERGENSVKKKPQDERDLHRVGAQPRDLSWRRVVVGLEGEGKWKVKRPSDLKQNPSGGKVHGPASCPQEREQKSIR